MTLPELCGCMFAVVGMVAGSFVPIITGWEWWTYLVAVPGGFLGGWIIGVLLSYLLVAMDKPAKSELDIDEPED